MTRTASRPVWEDGSWSGLPPLHNDLAVDVCVVGLGGSGLACVHELLDAGVRVAGIDAGAVAGAAAGRNGGFLLAGCYDFHHDAVARYGHDRALAIYRLTIAEIDRIAGETPAAVRRVGSVRLAMSEEERADCEAQRAAMVADGLPVEPYSAGGIDGLPTRQHSSSGNDGLPTRQHSSSGIDGLLIPTDAAFDPLLRARLLARSALERGARLHEHTPAVALDGNSVSTPRGRIACDAVVVAIDGGLVRLLPELSRRVRAARLQMLATAPDTSVSIPRPMYARFGLEYWQQLRDGRIALGGFRDRGGEDEWTESSEVTPAVQDALEHHLRHFIGSRAPVTHRWAATVGYTTTGLPVLEEVRRGVWATGGYSGTGNVIGSLCGRAAARLALGLTAPFARPLID